MQGLSCDLSFFGVDVPDQDIDDVGYYDQDFVRINDDTRRKTEYAELIRTIWRMFLLLVQ
jgi:hypothetical protein